MTALQQDIHQTLSNEDSPARLWQAVQERDEGYDGRFVYAVRSTGVYCRPTCPSRRPGRDQVRFFTGPEDAEGAGYRACRRCLPHRPSRLSQQAELVRRACEYIRGRIEEHPDGLPSLARLSEAAGVSPSHLQRVFKKETGLTPRQYAHAVRLERFKALLREGSDMSGAMLDAGFGSPSRLYEGANGQLGMTPGKYKKGGAGMTVNYLVTESSLGYLLVAATGQGVCSVKLGDGPSELLEELRAELPKASLQEGSEALRDWVGAVLEYLDGRRVGLDLPFDVQATAFQRRVWQLLQSIPYGETRTYQQLALEMGLGGNSSRAVGRACASNPVSLIVPCHRAVRKDGGLTGYRWGLERKEALLIMERGERRPENA